MGRKASGSASTWLDQLVSRDGAGPDGAPEHKAALEAPRAADLGELCSAWPRASQLDRVDDSATAHRAAACHVHGLEAAGCSLWALRDSDISVACGSADHDGMRRFDRASEPAAPLGARSRGQERGDSQSGDWLTAQVRRMVRSRGCPSLASLADTALSVCCLRRQRRMEKPPNLVRVEGIRGYCQELNAGQGLGYTFADRLITADAVTRLILRGWLLMATGFALVAWLLRDIRTIQPYPNTTTANATASSITEGAREAAADGAIRVGSRS